MAVLQHLYLLTEFLLDQLNHLLMERTGIAHRCALLDARGEGNDLCPTVNEQLGLEQYALAGAAATIRKANEFQFAIQVGKRATLVANGHEISSARTIVLGLHAANNTYFHHRICLVVTLECKGTKNLPHRADMGDTFGIYYD